VRTRTYVGVVTISLISTMVLREASHHIPPPIEPTIDVLPYEVRILLPGQLCDNLQGTLQYWIDTFLTTPQVGRPEILVNVQEVHSLMRLRGCITT
jgi:hypothetical protein